MRQVYSAAYARYVHDDGEPRAIVELHTYGERASDGTPLEKQAWYFMASTEQLLSMRDFFDEAAKKTEQTKQTLIEKWAGNS